MTDEKRDALEHNYECVLLPDVLKLLAGAQEHAAHLARHYAVERDEPEAAEWQSRANELAKLRREVAKHND